MAETKPGQLRHFILEGITETEAYRYSGGGGPGSSIPERDRTQHSRALLGVCAAGHFRKVWEREDSGEGLLQEVLWSRSGLNQASRRLLASSVGGGRPPRSSGLGGNPLLQAAIRALIRLMLRARHTKSHSPCTDRKPRRLNCRNPSCCLIHPWGASAIHFLRPYST